MKKAALILAALVAGAAAGTIEGACTCEGAQPVSFTRKGASYSSPGLVSSYRLTLAPDLKTVTETFSTQGHSYAVTYRARAAPSMSSFVWQVGDSLTAVDADDGRWIRADLATLRTVATKGWMLERQ
jgi:hypothetical protein